MEKLAELPVLKSPTENSFWAVVKGLLDPNPKTRLSVNEALAMPLFSQGNEKLNNKQERAHLFAELKQLADTQSTTHIPHTYMSKDEDQHYSFAYLAANDINIKTVNEGTKSDAYPPMKQSQQSFAQVAFFKSAPESKGEGSQDNVVAKKLSMSNAYL